VESTFNSTLLDGSKSTTKLPFLTPIINGNPGLINCYRLTFSPNATYFLNPTSPNDLTLSYVKNANGPVNYFMFVTVISTPSTNGSTYEVQGSSGVAIKLIEAPKKSLMNKCKHC